MHLSRWALKRVCNNPCLRIMCTVTHESLLVPQRLSLSENSFDEYSQEISPVLLFVCLNHDSNTRMHAYTHARTRDRIFPQKTREADPRNGKPSWSGWTQSLSSHFATRIKNLQEILLQIIINNIRVENFLHISAANFVDERGKNAICYISIK